MSRTRNEYTQQVAEEEYTSLGEGGSACSTSGHMNTLKRSPRNRFVGSPAERPSGGEISLGC